MAPAHGILIPSIKRMVAPDPPAKNQPTSGLHETLQTKYVANYEDDSRCTLSPEVIPTLLRSRYAATLGLLWRWTRNRFRSASFLQCSKFPINRLQLFFTLGWPKFLRDYWIAPGKTTTIIQKNANLKHIVWPISVPKPETEHDPEHVSYTRFQQQTLWNDCACNPSSRVTSLRLCVCVIVCGKNQKQL